MPSILRGGNVSDAPLAAADTQPSAPAIPAEPVDVRALLQGHPEIEWDGGYLYTLRRDYLPGMRTDARFYASPDLLGLVLSELKDSAAVGKGGGGGFLPAVRQLANVATLPGIVKSSIGMPDIHSGYGFAIGNVAAMDLDDPDAVVSPGGVGFDINCGVRLLRSDLTIDDMSPLVKSRLADELFRALPVGVGEGSVLGRLSESELDSVLSTGMGWAESRGLCWPADRALVEEGGCFAGAAPADVSPRAKMRGRAQCGSLGSGNHYAEVQVVDAIYDEESARAMGLKLGTICVMLHTGSRGLGHQVCTEAIDYVTAIMPTQGIKVVDRQLACCRVNSLEGRKYLSAMRCAANFAFVNRCLMAKGVRDTFAKVFQRSGEELGMDLVYDVSHNVAKEEYHVVNGQTRRLLVHRKGATRAFCPGHPEIPQKYQHIGQPVLVGGSMGTCSYVLTGTHGAMNQTFGSTCHGAGRAMSRTKAVRELDAKKVLRDVEAMGCITRVATKKLVAEEAPESYKDVSAVVDTCHLAGISRKCVRLRPIICIKG